MCVIAGSCFLEVKAQVDNPCLDACTLTLTLAGEEGSDSDSATLWVQNIIDASQLPLGKHHVAVECEPLCTPNTSNLLFWKVDGPECVILPQENPTLKGLQSQLELSVAYDWERAARDLGFIKKKRGVVWFFRLLLITWLLIVYRLKGE